MAVTPATQLRGLGLPVLRAAGGYFTSKNRYDVAFGDLLLAIFTPIGARPMSRSFGSALHRMLFEPNVLEQVQRVQYVITETAAAWLPHIQIRQVQMVLKGTVVSLRIIFSLVDDQQQESRFIEFDRSDLARSVASERKTQ